MEETNQTPQEEPRDPRCKNCRFHSWHLATGNGAYCLNDTTQYYQTHTGYTDTCHGFESGTAVDRPDLEGDRLVEWGLAEAAKPGR